MSELFDWWLAKFHGKKRLRPGGAEVCCPAHEDVNPSLGVDVGQDGRILLRCQAGCTVREIVAAAGAEMKDLFEPESRRAYARAQSHAVTVPATKPEPACALVFVDRSPEIGQLGRLVKKKGVCPACNGPVQPVVMAEPSPTDEAVVVAYCEAGCSADALVMALSGKLPSVDFEYWSPR